MQSSLFYVKEKSDLTVIGTGIMEVHLSRKNGCIIEIQDLRAGKTICSVADQPGDERMFSIIAMHHMNLSQTCEAHHQKNVVWNIMSDCVSILYSELTFDDEKSACSALVRISGTVEGGLHFHLHVDNNREDLIHAIRFPILPGWKNREGEEPFILTAGAKWQSKLGQMAPSGTAPSPNGISINYPGSQMYMPWLDISDSGIGLSIINYMEKPYVGGIGGLTTIAPGKKPQECYWWNHYPLIQKGRYWMSPPMGIGIHYGDWHVTADRYYEWFKETIGIPLKQPTSLRTSIGFQNIFLRSSVWRSSENMPAGSLSEYARLARQYGIRHFSIWDYPMSMGAYAMYVHNIDLMDYSPEERETMKNAIDEVKKEGVRISALINFRHINVKHDLYDTFQSEAVLCLDGSEQRENWTSPGTLGGNCIIMSPRSPMMRNRIDTLLDKYVELGYNAIFYDQPFLYSSNNIGLDYNYMGKENRPDDASSALYDTIAHVRSRLQALDSEAYTIGEQFDIFSASRALDLQMEWNFTNSGIEALARVLYACPNALLSYVINGTTFGETHASHAFAAGLLLCIYIDGGTSRYICSQHDVSPLAEHIGKLAKLREKCSSRMAYGRFRHNQGLTLLGDKGIVAYAYNSQEGPAVAMAAGAEGGIARIRLDTTQFQTPADRVRGILFLMTGETVNIQNEEQLEFDLGPNQVAVWYC